jgi:hypothetical protein
MEDFEKLGVFYLGKNYDLKAGKLLDELLLYDAKDLVTHAVCVGMTGSGKTGLCLALIEEAALDGIPAILIDPKGDLSDILLTFPELRPEDFQPWVNPDDANNKGMSVSDFARSQADLWRKGLADWGESGARIKQLRDAVDFRIFTPGSSSGFPVSILKSFAAPAQAILEDEELLRDRVSTTVTSLLGLVGVDADPNQSREAILLANILDHNWRKGQDMSLESLIEQIQNPPIQKVGVMNLEAYYPSKDRFNLVMALNNLLASPGFGIWLQGEALDIGDILHTPKGKPRVAIFSISHLDDNQRMFFVSLLLNQVLGWVRTQSGTTSLRAILYMDEIFGYLPPLSNPPSKLPMITLLKQARAFGLGLVLATQNPVDLDYKALSNTGTWFIGRLQTERDKMRLLDGLEGAAATTSQKFNRKEMEQILAGLGNRIFLLNNTHDDRPEIFQTRWAMSYLRGPLTRDQIKILMDPYKQKEPVITASNAPAGAAIPQHRVDQVPTVPPGVPCYYLPARPDLKDVIFQPEILGVARVRLLDTDTKLDITRNAIFHTALMDAAIPVDWTNATELNISADSILKTPPKSGSFTDLPEAAANKSNYATWTKDFTAWVSSTYTVKLLRSPSTNLVSNPGESEKDFRLRLVQAGREARDAQIEKLRQKYAPKIASLQNRLTREQDRVAREKEQARAQSLQSVVSVGATLLGAFTGRKILSSTNISRAATAVKGFTRAADQQGDVGRAQDSVKNVQQQLEELNKDFEDEKTQLNLASDPLSETLETIEVKPRKTDISVQLVSLLWAPYQSSGQSSLQAAF